MKQFYTNKNNLFQNPSWQEFQKATGKNPVEFGGFNGLKIDLPFKKNFIWVQRGPESLSKEILESALGVGRKEGALFIRFEPGSITKEVIDEFKLKQISKKSLLSGQASVKATRILDLRKTEEEILAQMKPKTRYNIRLAEKKGVKVQESKDVDELYSLLVATSGKKTGYYPHEKSYYQTMLSTLGKEGKLKIFTASYKGTPLSAILVSFFGDVAIYLHGGQSQEMRNLMAPYLCQWTAIKEARRIGCLYYDFWGVSELDDPNDPWAGISRFKEGFGGEKMIYPGSFDYVISPFWYNILTLAAKIKHFIRR